MFLFHFVVFRFSTSGKKNCKHVINNQLDSNPIEHHLKMGSVNLKDSWTLILISVRVWCVFYSIIPDCDEG